MIQVYFIFNPLAQRVKIGKTSGSLHWRADQLQRELGERLEIIASIPTSNTDAECIAHWYFRANRCEESNLGHEWFLITPEQALGFLARWIEDDGEAASIDYYASNRGSWHGRTKQAPSTCPVPDCTALVVTKGLCRRHFMRFAKRVSRGRASWDQLTAEVLRPQREIPGVSA